MATSLFVMPDPFLVQEVRAKNVAGLFLHDKDGNPGAEIPDGGGIVLALPTIGDYTNAQHDHSGAGDGGSLADGSISIDKLADLVALSIIARTANSNGAPSNLAATAGSGAVLRESGNVLGFGQVATAGLGDDVVTDAKLANMDQARVKGRASGAGTGDPGDLTAAQLVALLQTDAAFNEAVQDGMGSAFFNSATVSWGYSDALNIFTADVINDSVSNAKLANMVQATVKGRADGAGTGDPVDLTASQLNTIVGTANLVMADTLRIETDEVRARSVSGLKLYDDGGNGVFIEDGGNVIVGGTSPTGKLQVNGSLGNWYIDSTGAIQVFTRNAGNYLNANGAAGYFNFITGGNTANDASATLRLLANRDVLIPNGNVGIGALSPSVPLHLAGSAPQFRFQNTEAGGGDWLFYASQNGDSIGGGYFTLRRQGDATSASALVIDQSRNVGINDASPDGKLDVVQSSTTATIPVLELEQADLSEEMINFVATVGTGNPIEAVGSKTLTTTHFVRVAFNGSFRYIPIGTIA